MSLPRQRHHGSPSAHHRPALDFGLINAPSQQPSDPIDVDDACDLDAAAFSSNKGDTTVMFIPETPISTRDESPFPLMDADRTGCDEVLDRVVFEEFGEIEAYLPDVDFFGRVPIRLTINQDSGPVMEVGTFDIDSRKDVDILKRAIAAWELTRWRTLRRDAIGAEAAPGVDRAGGGEGLD